MHGQLATMSMTPNTSVFAPGWTLGLHAEQECCVCVGQQQVLRLAPPARHSVGAKGTCTVW